MFIIDTRYYSRIYTILSDYMGIYAMPQPHWLIQRGLYHEEHDFALVERTLAIHDISFTPVDVQHGHVITDLPHYPDPVIILGGYSLMRYAQAHHLAPGYYDVQDMHAWMHHYGEHMLNAGAYIGPLQNAAPNDCVFVRPAADSKAFAGTTLDSPEEFHQWRMDMIATRPLCTPDLPIVMAPLVAIHRESRFFVIDKKIIGASVYKINGQIRTTPHVYPEETAFVERMIATWTPTRAFVIDIATTDMGQKIVELNCINCAGFYEANIPAIILALNDIATTP